MTPIRSIGRIPGRALLLICLAAGLAAGSARAAADGDSGAAAGERFGDEPLTLAAWSSLKEEADRFYSMPPGAQRIAGCEAFLKKHPEYPNPEPLLRIIVQDSLQTGRYDPQHVAGILEKLAATGSSDTYGRSGLGLVERYYLKYHLPLESARRILDRSRRTLEKSRAESALEMDPGVREYLWFDSIEFQLLLDEGRVLLAGGDAAGALKKLQEAEELFKRASGFVELHPARGRETIYLPLINPLMSGWNLAMAQALAHLGNARGAQEHLAWVRGSGGTFDLLDSETEKLRSDLKVAESPALALRSDPAPATAFSLPDLEGGKVELSAYKGKVVLLYIWAMG